MRNLQSILFVLTITVPILLLSCSPKGPDADIVIKNINVVDVNQGRLLADRNIHIKDGTIISTTQPPGNAETVIDGKGKYLIPGLWDFHVHFRGGDTLIAENRHLLNLYLANGVTTVRDAGGDLAEAVLRWRDQIEAGIMKGPQIFTSGLKLDGPDPTWAGSIELTDTSQVKAAIDSLVSMEVDYVKLYDSTIPADVYLEAIEQAEKADLPVTGHMPYTVNFRKTVEKGLDATEHMYYVFKGTSASEEEITRKMAEGEIGFGEALNTIRQTYSPKYAGATYQLMKEEGTGVVPTMYIMEVLGNLHREDHSDDEYLDYIGEGIQKTYERRLQSARQRDEDAPNIYKDLLDEFSGIINQMHDMGVPIYAGSDSGPFNSFVYPGTALHKELEWLVRSGLTPAEALSSATIEPASFFGLQDSLSQVKKGYRADLVILEKNPLDDISNTRSIHTIILKGQHIIDEQDRKRLLRRQ